MTGVWLFLGCVVFLLGAALPLLRKKDVPPPPPGGWRNLEEPEDS